MMRSLFIGAVSLTAVVSAAPALAAVTYTLTNVETPTNARDGGVVNYVDLHAPITFQFTVASALAANAALFWNGSDVQSWLATGGKATSTISSDKTKYPDENLSRLWITTDASANIDTWNIVAKATDPAIDGGQYGVSPQFNWFSSGSGPFTTIRFIENHYNQNTGGVICTSGCTQRFVQSDETAPVPEPATWLMMILGFGLVGGSMRRDPRTSALA